MADLKITQLTADTNPALADLFVTAKSPFGAGSNRKVTIADLLTARGIITGSLTSTQVPFASASNVLAGDSNFIWDNTNKRLTVGITPTFNPTSTLVVAKNDNSTSGQTVLLNTQLQLTQTADTNGTYNAFQFTINNAGVTAGKVFLGPAITAGISNVTWSVAATANNGLAGHTGSISVTDGTVGSNTIGNGGVVTIGGSAFVNAAYGLTGRIAITGGAAITTAAAIWARPVLNSGFAGFIGTIYGAKIDAPGAGTGTEFTLGVDSGNSYVAGALKIGAASAATATLDILQPASTGNPLGFLFTSGTHTSLTAGTEVFSARWNLSSTKTRAAGNFSQQREFLIDAPTYAAAGLTEIVSTATVAITGAPISSTNITQDISSGLWVQQFQSYGAIGSFAMRFDMPGIANGIAGTDVLAGVGLLSFGSIILGNQTATTSVVTGIYLSSSSFDTNANVRTVTDGSTVYIGGVPVSASNNVLFSTGTWGLHITGRNDSFNNNGTNITRAVHIEDYSVLCANNTNITATGMSVIGIGQATISPNGGSLTLGSFASLYLKGAGIAGTGGGGTSVTITNNYVAWFDSGDFRTDGDIILGGSGAQNIKTTSTAGVTRSINFDIPVGAGGAANAALDYQFKLDGILEAGLLAETDGAGTYREPVFKVPHYSGDYGIAWGTAPTPAPTSLANGSMFVAYNSNAGVLSSRIYVYTNSTWKSVALT